MPPNSTPRRLPAELPQTGSNSSVPTAREDRDHPGTAPPLGDAIGRDELSAHQTWSGGREYGGPGAGARRLQDQAHQARDDGEPLGAPGRPGALAAEAGGRPARVAGDA